VGTINYFTSDYITLGYNCSNINYNDEYYYDFIDDEYFQIKYLLEKEHFYYFHVTLKPGYYEGFSINIENNFSYCFDNYNEKLQALKELTRIKKFLIYIVDNFNVCEVWPGWCTSYKEYYTTIKDISTAIKEMKTEIKNTPTYYMLRRAGEI
jgi:hypothetical protein